MSKRMDIAVGTHSVGQGVRIQNFALQEDRDTTGKKVFVHYLTIMAY
jgi:hypothetical protein